MKKRKILFCALLCALGAAVFSLLASADSAVYVNAGTADFSSASGAMIAVEKNGNRYVDYDRDRATVYDVSLGMNPMPYGFKYLIYEYEFSSGVGYSDLGEASVRPNVRNAAGSALSIKGTALGGPKNGKVRIYSTSDYSEGFDFDATSDVWHKVTVVYRVDADYDETTHAVTADRSSMTVFLDGVFAFRSEGGVFSAGSARIDSVRIDNVNASKTDNHGHVGVDNVRLFGFTDGYTGAIDKLFALSDATHTSLFVNSAGTATVWTEVYTDAQFREAVGVGGKIRLGADITVSTDRQYAANQTTEVDLNGHRLTYSAECNYVCRNASSASMSVYFYSGVPGGVIDASLCKACAFFSDDGCEIILGTNPAKTVSADNFTVIAKKLTHYIYGTGIRILGGLYVKAGNSVFLETRRVNAMENATFFSYGAAGSWILANEGNVNFKNCTFIGDGGCALMSADSVKNITFTNGTFADVKLKRAGSGTVSFSGRTAASSFAPEGLTLPSGKVFAKQDGESGLFRFERGEYRRTAQLLYLLSDVGATLTVTRGENTEYYLAGAYLDAPDTEEYGYTDGDGNLYLPTGKWTYKYGGVTVSEGGAVTSADLGKTYVAEAQYEVHSRIAYTYKYGGVTHTVERGSEDSFASLFDLGKGTYEIKLFSDLKLSETVTIGGSSSDTYTVKIDLNGHTLDTDSGKLNRGFFIKWSTTLAIYSTVPGAKLLGSSVGVLVQEDNSVSRFVIGSDAYDKTAAGMIGNLSVYGNLTNGYGQTFVRGVRVYSAGALMTFGNNNANVFDQSEFYCSLGTTLLSFGTGARTNTSFTKCLFVSENRNSELWKHSAPAGVSVKVTFSDCTFAGMKISPMNTETAKAGNYVRFTDCSFASADDVPSFLTEGGKVAAFRIPENVRTLCYSDGRTAALDCICQVSERAAAGKVTWVMADGFSTAEEYWILGQTPTEPSYPRMYVSRIDEETDRYVYLTDWVFGTTPLSSLTVTGDVSLTATKKEKDAICVLLSADGQPIRILLPDGEHPTADGPLFASFVNSYASSGALIKVLRDVSLQESLVLDNGAKIDLNGKTLRFFGASESFLIGNTAGGVIIQIGSSKPGAVIRADETCGADAVCFGFTGASRVTVSSAFTVIAPALLSSEYAAATVRLSDLSFLSTASDGGALVRIGSALDMSGVLMIYRGEDLSSFFDILGGSAVTVKDCTLIDLSRTAKLCNADDVCTLPCNFLGCRLSGLSVSGEKFSSLRIGATDTSDLLCDLCAGEYYLDTSYYKVPANVKMKYTVGGEVCTVTYKSAVTKDFSHISRITYVNDNGDTVGTETVYYGSECTFVGAGKIYGKFYYVPETRCSFGGGESVCRAVLTADELGSVKSALVLYGGMDIRLYFDSEYFRGARIGGETFSFRPTDATVTIGGRSYYAATFRMDGAADALYDFEVVGLVGEDAIGYTFRFSVADYCEKLLGSSYDLALLAASALRYVREAALYEDGTADVRRIDGVLAKYEAAGITENTDPIESAPAPEIGACGVLGARVLTRSAPGFAFSLASDYHGTVRVSYTDVKGKVRSRVLTEDDLAVVDGVRYLTFPDMGAQDFLSALTVTVSADGGYGEAQFSYSLAQYVASVGGAKRTAEALYRYAEAARNYYRTL